MRPFTIAAALILLTGSISALRAADRASDEPAIQDDLRPTDLTTGRRGSSDEPAIRDDPRARDLSASKTSVGRSTIEVGGLTPEQSDKVRAIRARAAEEIQVIRDRESAEVMAVLNEQQRAEFLKIEEDQDADRLRRVTTRPATTASE